MHDVKARIASLPMTPDERTFFEGLGQRIASARKNADMTQQQLADRLGIPQPQLASYEIGRRRVPVSLLQPLARTLHVTLEGLIDEAPSAQPVQPGRTRRGPASKLEQQLDAITRLPKA
ncbi:MAG: helix-turn-helix transcriptional regulator, partial [Novosphingobium sp.]